MGRRFSCAEDRVRSDLSLPKVDSTGSEDASATDDHDSLIARHAQYLIDSLSAKVLCNAAMMMHEEWQAKAVFSAAELVTCVKQLLGGNAAKSGTAEHAVCGVLETMNMDAERMCMLLPKDTVHLIPFRMRPCASEVTEALSRVWSRVRNVALSGGDVAQCLDANLQVPCVCVCVCVNVCVCVRARASVRACVLCVCIYFVSMYFVVAVYM
jgi:hypothetical protein